MNLIQRFIVRQQLKYIQREVSMSGWKTKLAGIAGLLTGAGTAIHGFTAGDWGQVYQGWLIAVGGLTALGVGHKLDKVTLAVKAVLPNK